MRYPTILILATATVMLAQQPAPPPPPPTDIAGMDDGAGADEPGRPVARLSVASGEVSVRRGDTAEWEAAALNIPLIEGDSVSVARQAAAEVQLDNAHFARMAGDSEIRIMNVDGAEHRVQLGRGLLTWRVLRDSQASAEISTPMAAVRPLGLSSVRVEVAPDTTTRITVRHGEADVQTARGAERVREGGLLTVRPGGEYQITAAAPADRWDTWSDQRDAYLTRAASPKYVSQDMYGTEDLDPYGRWDHDPAYGDVWMPSVPATWAPYRDGRWVWEDYYGWTWVDYQPWGWAPFHYGSWYQRPGYGWCWFPGARSARVWWRPAMVGFFGYGGGGSGIGFGFGNVGWVPLAPYERYRPWYGRGWNGGRNVMVTNINITNVYRNSRFGNGATAVSAGDFQRGNYRNRVAVDPSHLQQASLVRGAGMTPTQDHLRFSERSVGVGGPRSDFGNRSFYSGSQAVNRGSASIARVPFNQQQQQVRSVLEGARQNGGNGRQFGGNSPSGLRVPGGSQTRQGEVAQGSQQRFGSPRQDATAPAAQPNSGIGVQRFGATQGSVNVQQPVVRQRESQPQAAPRYDSSFGNPGARGGGPQQAPQYSPPPQRSQAPQYRSAPAPQQQAPQYRSAPAPQQQAPQQRSAPQQQYHSAPAHGNGGGGGQRGNSGGDGGNRKGR